MPRRSVMSGAVALMALATVVVGSQTAYAGPIGAVDTSVLFVVGPEPLTISVGDGSPVQLGRAEAGNSTTGQMGTVTVTGPASWVASVVATDFVTADEKPQIIPARAISYWSGPVVEGTGKADFKPGQETAEQAQRLDPSELQTAFSCSGSGSTRVTWNPTLVVDVPGESLPGIYSGTVTHSVA